MLNIAYNALCGGTTLDDIEARRADRVFLDGIGAESLPDPTTAGDFCRRFDPDSVMALQEAVNRARLKVWAVQAPSFFAERAVIDADASIIATDGETKEGMDIAYNGTWGYSALMVSFANTKEPLYFQAVRCQPSLARGSCGALRPGRRAGAGSGLYRGPAPRRHRLRSLSTSTGGTPTGCSSSSVSTPGRTSWRRPRALTTRCTTSSSGAPNGRSRPAPGGARRR